MSNLKGSALEKAFIKGMRDKEKAASLHVLRDSKQTIHYLVRALRRFNEVLESGEVGNATYHKLCEARDWSIRLLQQLYPDKAWKHLQNELEGTTLDMGSRMPSLLNENLISIEYLDKFIKPAIFSKSGKDISEDVKEDGRMARGTQTDTIVIKQMEYLTQLCELVIQKAPNCRKITVHTEECDKQKENGMFFRVQSNAFELLRQNVKPHGIDLEFKLLAQQDETNAQKIFMDLIVIKNRKHIKVDALERLKRDLDNFDIYDVHLEDGRQFCPKCGELMGGETEELDKSYNRLKSILKMKGIKLTIGTRPRKQHAQHNREFKFDYHDKTVRIILDWGLDLYQNSKSRFEVGAYSLAQRRCKQTDVSYYEQVAAVHPSPIVMPGKLDTMPADRIVFNAPLDERNRTRTLQLKNLSDFNIAWTLMPAKKGKISVDTDNGILNPMASIIVAVTSADNLSETGEKLELKWTNRAEDGQRSNHDHFSNDSSVMRKFIRIEYNA